MKDVATAAPGNALWRDRAWQRSLGASCLLHSAVFLSVLVAWHIEPKPFPELHSIPVTLVRTDEIAPQHAAQLAPEQPIPPPKKPPAKPTLPVVAAAKPIQAPVPPVKPAHVATPHAKPARPPAPAVTPKPDATITALLSESIDGRPQIGAAPRSTAIALRSSAKLSNDYMLRLQAWIARQERYPAEAREHRQEGKGVVAFTIARDGNITRVWTNQSTGSSLLDQASIATIRDASPVPALPHDIAGNSVDFFLPINYTLSTFERLFE